MSQQDATLTSQNEDSLSSSLVFSLATGAGLSVAAIYYNQPMLGAIGQDFHADAGTTGLIATLTQIGYALGILFLVPLGDRFDRRKVIFSKSIFLALALLLYSFMPSISGLLITSLAIGIMATMAQDIVPASAALVSMQHRGRMIGSVMTGLFLGIILSRVISGFVTEYLGWRAMYQLAALSILLIGLTLWRIIPSFKPDTNLNYPALLASMWALWKKYPSLRRAGIAQGLISFAFSAFWSTLVFMLHDSFNFGSTVAGIFSLAGLSGALSSSISGRVSDSKGPGHVTRLGAALVTMSFVIMFLQPFLSREAQIALILIGAVGFNFGFQATQVAHQTIVYGLDAAARGRLNAIFFTCVFIGMATGSAIASQVLTHVGWTGVVTIAAGAGLLSFIIRMMTSDK